jgi:hypothetical protein
LYTTGIVNISYIIAGGGGGGGGGTRIKINYGLGTTRISQPGDGGDAGELYNGTVQLDAGYQYSISGTAGTGGIGVFGDHGIDGSASTLTITRITDNAIVLNANAPGGNGGQKSGVGYIQGVHGGTGGTCYYFDSGWNTKSLVGSDGSTTTLIGGDGAGWPEEAISSDDMATYLPNQVTSTYFGLTCGGAGGNARDSDVNIVGRGGKYNMVQGGGDGGNLNDDGGNAYLYGSGGGGGGGKGNNGSKTTGGKGSDGIIVLRFDNNEIA